MKPLFASALHVTTVESQRRRNQLEWWVLFAAMLWSALVIAGIAYSRAPEPFPLAVLLLASACVTVLIRPAAGIHIIILFTLAGDASTVPWWPFTKNLSSRESILFVSDGLSVTPLEIVLFFTVFSTILRVICEPSWRFRRGALTVPIGILGALVLYGFVHGAMTSHDRRIAIFESRPLFYLVTVYLMITTLFTERRQYRLAFGLAILAISIQGLFSLRYWRALSAAQRQLAESLSEHTASISMNMMFIFFIGLIVFDGRHWKRWAVAAMVSWTFYVYLLGQRRSGMVALFIGAIALFAILYVRNRPRFWRITPWVLLASIIYIVATWNAEGMLGLPANAVKSAFFPGQLSLEDQQSDIYREIEGYNLWETIRASPIQGFGFGHPFLVVWPMPDITFFEFWQYLPHNSVLWIWIKLGVFGFITTVFVLARATQLGARYARQATDPDDVAMVTAALAYVVMFAVFAYVDIAWSITPAVLLGLALAICTDMSAARAGVGAPVDSAKRRGDPRRQRD